MAFRAGYSSGLARWVVDHFIQDVPDAAALCEFDCRQAQCTQGDWACCERRLSYAAGELMPVNIEEQ